MKISYNWLNQYINIQESPEKTGQVLTDTGLEVEKIEKFETVEGGLEGLIIGQVVECYSHPNADKLKITKVDIGSDEMSQIICGAPNVAEGQKVVVATPGTTIYPVSNDPFTLKKAKIRGELSFGMICAEDEIGIGEDHSGIIVLDTDLPNGTPASDYYKVETDYIYEIGLTPNRGDATSHIGTARDLKAVWGNDICWPSVETFKEGAKETIKVEVKNSQACPRYSSVVISNIKVKESPDWLKNRLKSIGLSPINNIVDITNYVAHELGQPLHAFNADAIKGSKVIVRTLDENTSFVTLDEEKRKLSSNDLMICNAEEGMCIAGVFGGLYSGIKEDTTTVFLESAYFSPDYIRATSQKHQLKTDASFRYERGTDPEITVYALKRAALLMQEIAGGEISSPISDIYPEKIQPNKIEVKYKNIDRLIGKSIERNEIERILKALDIEVTNKTEQGFQAVSPAYRMDVTREADIIEEILRIYGFNRIPIPSHVSSDFLADFPERDPDKLRLAITNYLVSNGFYEVMTNSLTKPVYSELDVSVDSSQNVAILNYLSEDLSVMRQKLYFNILEVIAYNKSHKQSNLKLFEFGKTYKKQKGKYSEKQEILLAMSGKDQDESWTGKSTNISFFDLSRHISHILRLTVGDLFSTEIVEDKSFQYALSYSVDSKVIATAGLLGKEICDKAGIKDDLFIAEIDWQNLINKVSTGLVYREVPKFPEVKRDLSLVLDKNLKYEKIKTLALKNGGRILKKIQVFDVYEGDKIPDDKKAYAMTFILQDEEKTLTDKVIDKTMSKLMGVFERELNATIRK